MDLTSVKSEVLSPGRRRLCLVEGDINNEATKCIKRRRRDPSSLLSCNINQQGQQQPEQQLLLPQVDQSAPTTPTPTPTATTTTTVKRSSRFRGVSRHRWTGRFEAHLWDKGTWNATQRKKGKQVYLGAYDEEESAARAYDLAAIKYWGTSTFTNFPASDYEKEVEIMQNVTREEYLAFLRRKSSGFSRGVSKYRGVAKHHHNGRWEARIGRVFGNKYLYLGTYSTQEEAAHAYDIAAIEYRGINAVTNFDLSTYIRWLRSPGGVNSLASQEPPRPSIEICSPKPTYADDCIACEQPKLPFSINQFKVDDLGTPRKQENFQGKIPINPTTNNSKSSSSPTALGLLFRSSIFRELMEKNPNANNEDTKEGTDTKNESQIGNENGFGRVIYDGVGNVPYVSSSSRDALPALQSHIELQEGAASSSFNRTGQSFWNGAFNMPPSIH